MTILPAIDPIWASAVSIAAHGTEMTMTSAPAPSSGSPSRALISRANAASCSRSCVKLTVTSWPASASLRAMLPPMFPAPTIPTRIFANLLSSYPTRLPSL